MRKVDICDLCVHEDFGYCGLRPKELSYEHDKDGDLVKCSGFKLDVELTTRKFKKVV